MVDKTLLGIVGTGDGDSSGDSRISDPIAKYEEELALKQQLIDQLKSDLAALKDFKGDATLMIMRAMMDMGQIQQQKTAVFEAMAGVVGGIMSVQADMQKIVSEGPNVSFSEAKRVVEDFQLLEQALTKFSQTTDKSGAMDPSTAETILGQLNSLNTDGFEGVLSSKDPKSITVKTLIVEGCIKRFGSSGTDFDPAFKKVQNDFQEQSTTLSSANAAVNVQVQQSSTNMTACFQSVANALQGLIKLMNVLLQRTPQN